MLSNLPPLWEIADLCAAKSHVGFSQIMEEQKKEAREGLVDTASLVDSLEKIYQMEVTRLSPADFEAFRAKTKFVYDKWARDIGVELIRSAERLAGPRKPN